MRRTDLGTFKPGSAGDATILRLSAAIRFRQFRRGKAERAREGWPRSALSLPENAPAPSSDPWKGGPSWS